jgi:HSP20 family protein
MAKMVHWNEAIINQAAMVIPNMAMTFQHHTVHRQQARLVPLPVRPLRPTRQSTKHARLILFATLGTQFFGDPLREVRRLQKELERAFESVPLETEQEQHETPKEEFWRPLADIVELADKMVVRLDLAGVKKENVTIELTPRKLRISGERKLDTNEKFRLNERPYGKFRRNFTVPVDITENDIHAKFENGLLEVSWNKVQPEAMRKTIPIFEETAGEKVQQELPLPGEERR